MCKIMDHRHSDCCDFITTLIITYFIFNNGEFSDIRDNGRGYGKQTGFNFRNQSLIQGDIPINGITCTQLHLGTKDIDTLPQRIVNSVRMPCIGTTNTRRMTQNTIIIYIPEPVSP